MDTVEEKEHANSYSSDLCPLCGKPLFSFFLGVLGVLAHSPAANVKALKGVVTLR
jgi:hypothetical protein